MTQEMHQSRMTESSLTDEMIQSMRNLQGTNLRIDHSIMNEEATRIAILKFAAGIGDINPLWTDSNYAADSAYKSLVAPPSFVIGVFSGLQFGWPGLGSFHGSSKLRFFRPILVNDKITPTCRYDGFIGPKRSSFADVMVMDMFTNVYRNQREETVAEIEWTVINVERRRAKANAKEHELLLPHPWSDEDLVEIETQVRSEQPRGRALRYWEHVSRGDSLETLTKGPIGMTDEVAFVAGGGAPIPRLAAHAAALKDYARHPAWAFRDPEFHSLEPVYSVHYNRHAARAMGVPYQYDVGFQRQCWQVQLLTHWMGDEGWIKAAQAQYRRFVYLSDVVRLSGRVLDKYVDQDGEPCVDVETEAINQRGENVMPGSATIILPSQDYGSSPIPRRLPT